MENKSEAKYKSCDDIVGGKAREVAAV